MAFGLGRKFRIKLSHAIANLLLLFLDLFELFLCTLRVFSVQFLR